MGRKVRNREKDLEKLEQHLQEKAETFRSVSEAIQELEEQSAGGAESSSSSSRLLPWLLGSVAVNLAGAATALAPALLPALSREAGERLGRAAASLGELVGGGGAGEHMDLGGLLGGGVGEQLALGEQVLEQAMLEQENMQGENSLQYREQYQPPTQQWGEMQQQQQQQQQQQLQQQLQKQQQQQQPNNIHTQFQQNIQEQPLVKQLQQQQQFLQSQTQHDPMQQQLHPTSQEERQHQLQHLESYPEKEIAQQPHPLGDFYLQYTPHQLQQQQLLQQLHQQQELKGQHESRQNQQQNNPTWKWSSSSYTEHDWSGRFK